MDFDVFSAGEISWRNAQSMGDVIELICVYGHLADKPFRATIPPIPSSDAIDPARACASQREAGGPTGNITLTPIAFVARGL